MRICNDRSGKVRTGSVINGWFRVGLLLTGFGLSMLMAHAQKTEAFRSPEAEATAKTLKVEIDQELKAPGLPDWAGVYLYGDGTGVNIHLSLAPKKGYLFENYGCGGLYERNWGPVAWTGDRIRLTHTLPVDPDPRPVWRVPDELIPVRWGERHYLVAPGDGMITFCNAINAGDEPRDNIHRFFGFFYLRQGDEMRLAEGVPSLPKEYQKYLLKSPIEAVITDVKPGARCQDQATSYSSILTTVTVNAGSGHGLRTGMSLYVSEPQARTFSPIKLTQVDVDRAVGEIRTLGQVESIPKVGLKVSTQGLMGKLRERKKAEQAQTPPATGPK